MNQLQFPPKFVLSIFIISCFPFLVHSQQRYSGLVAEDCNNFNESATVLGYQCNGQNRTCKSYLTFRAHPSFNTVSSISSLLGSDPLELSQLNSVSQDAVFEPNKTVLVPVTCSCSGPHYQANTTYVVRSLDIYKSIAQVSFQGLTTCQAIQDQNRNLSSDGLFVGTRINVPLRCACPTKNQSDDGVNYLLTYVIVEGQWVEMISTMFGVGTERTLEANGLTLDAATVFPATTLLVPLQNPPSISQVLSPPPPSQQPPTTPIAPPPGGGSNKTWIYAVVGSLGGFFLAIGMGILLFCFCFRKKKEKTDSINISQSFESIEKPLNERKLDENSGNFASESIYSIAQSLKVYTFQELQIATENFSPNCLIKGSVYRGNINGDFAAIKKKSGDVREEINLLNKVNHMNLIRLSGVCFNNGDWYLVYEYAANGPLSDWIHSNRGGNKDFLNWTKRIQIGLDVATGLNYLHSYTSPPYVHKDLNSNNVLLDGDFRAKISNFRLARSADGQGGEFALTRHIIGTKGYMAPEYLENGLISPKLDVYAFGVLMLEILTGEEVSDILIPLFGNKEVKEENLSKFMDSSLQGNYPSDLAMSIIGLTHSCLKKDPSARPSMHEIVQSLSGALLNSLTWESKHSFSIV